MKLVIFGAVFILLNFALFNENVKVLAEVDDFRYQQWYVEIPQKLTDWQSLDELKAFLNADDTDTKKYFKANSAGVIELNSGCVDQAEHLRDKAAETGRHLEILIVEPREYRRIFKSGKSTYHAVSLARIGDYFYAIEPDTDQVVRAYKVP